MQQILSSGSWMHDLSEFAMARCWPWAWPGLPQTHQTPPLACSPVSTAQPTAQPKTQGHRQGWCFGPGPASGSLSQTFANQPPGDGTALKTPAQQQQRRRGCPHLRRDSCPTCLRSGAAVRSCLQLDERQYGQASTFVAPAPARCHTLLERATEKGHRRRLRTSTSTEGYPGLLPFPATAPFFVALAQKGSSRHVCLHLLHFDEALGVRTQIPRS